MFTGIIICIFGLRTNQHSLIMKNRFLLLAALAAMLLGVSCSSVHRVSSVSVVQPGFELEECDIENPGTRMFLEEVDYSNDPDYTLSFARDYRKEHGANDKPLPVKISWDGGTAAKIQMSSSPLFEGPFEVEAQASPAEVFNLVPGEKYYYKVLAADGKVLKQACVVPVGPLRMINGVVGNMRDLGGWKASGGHIAYGKLYRGAALERISDKGREIFLKDLGISVDLDLRGIKESEFKVGAVMPETVYLKLPVEKNLGRGTGNTQELYQQAIRSIIGWLGEGRAVFFHCAGGADRTGSLAFLIEALLGVSESDLSKDYELTTFGRANTRLRNYRATEEETHILYELVTYLRTFGAPGTSINDLALNWATTRHSDSVDPLTPSEIQLLRQYLLVRE